MESTHRSDEYQEKIRRSANLLKLLGHPIRLCIMSKLVDEGEKNVTEIESCLDTSQSSVSQHLARLREAGLVDTRKEGNLVFYHVASEKARRVVGELIGGEES